VLVKHWLETRGWLKTSLWFEALWLEGLGLTGRVAGRILQYCTACRGALKVVGPEEEGQEAEGGGGHLRAGFGGGHLGAGLGGGHLGAGLGGGHRCS
jgi:hypothetical protein